MQRFDRRTFLTSTAAASAAALWPNERAEARPSFGAAGPVAISSGNGIPAVDRAMELLRTGADPAYAVVEGVTLVELDEKDMSVGYGGLPNENGVVQLDASVMHGPTHKAGSVAALENIRTPARVALEVLRRTDHVMLVGDGALSFATGLGFPEQEMLTERSRQAWLRWKRNLNPNDDWLDDDQQVAPPPEEAALGPIPHTWGTIHCAALDGKGDVGACTTTSGLSYKVPGRVGDSPIIGAGMFVDNAVGAAGATGRGESAIQSCASFQVVERMAHGDEPTEACLAVLRWVAAHTRRKDLLNERGEPNFGLTLYALRKDGLYGSASMRGKPRFAVHDGTSSRKIPAASLY
jgi:N4-(beta-N-acetylglucosaminyl)-L-asparaginase